MSALASYPTILTAVIPVFGVVALGYLVRKLGWLTAEADRSLMRLVVNLFYPAIILTFILGNEALETATNLLWPPLLGFGLIVFGFAVAWAAARVAGLRGGPPRRTFAFTGGIYNYGYIPIPLALALFDDRAVMGVLFVHNVGVEIALWTVGIILVSGGTQGGSWRRIVNPPLLALMAGLVLNFSGAEPHIPAIARTMIDMLAACAIPVGLLLTGAVLGDETRGLRWGEHWRVPVMACAVRLLLLPVAFLALALVLPVSPAMQKVMVIQAAMPSGILPIVLARHFGGDAGIALRVVLATSLLGLFTIPLWIALGLALVGG